MDRFIQGYERLATAQKVNGSEPRHPFQDTKVRPSLFCESLEEYLLSDIFGIVHVSKNPVRNQQNRLTMLFY